MTVPLKKKIKWINKGENILSYKTQIYTSFSLLAVKIFYTTRR